MNPSLRPDWPTLYKPNGQPSVPLVCPQDSLGPEACPPSAAWADRPPRETRGGSGGEARVRAAETGGRGAERSARPEARSRSDLRIWTHGAGVPRWEGPGVPPLDPQVQAREAGVRWLGWVFATSGAGGVQC